VAARPSEGPAGAEPGALDGLGLELALLCDALDLLDAGAFLFAVCEEGPLRERLQRQVREHLQAAGGRDVVSAELSPNQPDLAAQLERQLLYDLPPEGQGEAPSAEAVPAMVRERVHPPVVYVHVHALADAGTSVNHLPSDDPRRLEIERARRALRALNLQRERLRRLRAPLVFWLGQGTLGQVVQYAADVYAARGGLFYFQTPLRPPSAPPAMHAEAATDLLDRYHRTLLPPEELRRRAALYERRLERERAAEAPHWPGIAALCRDLASVYRELDDYRHVSAFQEEAIDAYHQAVVDLEIGDKGQEWAALQHALGRMYHARMGGDRAENVERAMGHYQQALEVYTREAFPEQWAMTQGNLGTAYGERIRGERAENMERAIEYCQLALEVYTRQALPEQWAGVQNNLGLAYWNRLRGERAENVERAIRHYQQALEVRARGAFPSEWATTQNNLGVAYLDRVGGERAENVERTVEHCQLALEVHTREAFPEQWAMTQNNLGNAYRERIRGEHAENLERAICHYRQALEVRTRGAFPEQWAGAQYNLGLAYSDRICGKHAENVEQAIGHYQQALEVYTREAFPEQWAMVQRNLENLDRR
jgi:tetratricopeptide (TPR) repeat protein